MTSNNPMQLFIAAFQEERAAEATWTDLKTARIAGLIGIENMAIIRRDAKEKIHIKEQGDPGGGKGAVIGGVLGGAIGMIAGPLGAVVVGGAAGALVGGLTAKVYDSGIPDDRLKEIGEALSPGTSAIVALIEHKWVGELEKELADTEAKILTQAVSAEIAAQLAQGKDVALTAVADESGVMVGKVAGNADAIEGAVLTSNAEGTAVAAFSGTAEPAAEEQPETTEAEPEETDETQA